MLPETFTPAFLRRLELLKLRSRRTFLGSRQGGHLSLKRGHGIEFSDYRKYELGDHPRHIDWNVYARNERLYIKRFQEEQDLSVLIIVDTSASMGMSGDESKWICARDVAISLAYIALMQQDTVYLAALGSHISPAHYGARAVHQVARTLATLSPKGQIDFVQEIQRAASRMKFPGVAVVVSDFLMPIEIIEQSFNILRAKNLDITAIQILSQRDLQPLENVNSIVAVDSETGEEVSFGVNDEVRQEYDQLLAKHTAWLESYFMGARVSFVRAQSEQALSHVIIEKIASTGLLQQ